MHGIDQVYSFPEHRHEQATHNDGGEVIEIHVGDLTGITDRNRLHASIANLRNECCKARSEIHEMLISLDLPRFETWKIESALDCIFQQVIANLLADVL